MCPKMENVSWWIVWFVFNTVVPHVAGVRLVSINAYVTSSSRYNDWDPNDTTDGDLRRDPDGCLCCAATTQELNPWYKLDLGQIYTIQHINVLGRGGDGDTYDPNKSNRQSFQNMELKLGTTKSNGTVLSEVDEHIYVYNYTLASPTPGRYVTLTLRNVTKYFTICEVSVYAECQPGTFGINCTNTCGICVEGTPCDTVTGRCLGGCDPGFLGSLCNQQCQPGTFGKNCTKTCGNCVEGTPCNTVTGQCPGGCDPGFHGSLCNQQCQPGTFGKNCTNTCGFCVEGTPCNTVTGRCPGGCDPGFHGSLCNQACQTGFYGVNCQLPCGHCRGNTVCLADTGNCPSGCEPGYYGPLCHRECDDGLYGDSCTSKCGHCQNGNACNKQNGTCLVCDCGYTGHDCKMEIADTKGPTGVSSSCELPPLIGAFVGGAGAVLVIEAAVAVVVYFVRRRKQANKGEEHPYEIPKL